jgi:uncharacterized protein YkwD
MSPRARALLAVVLASCAVWGVRATPPEKGKLKLTEEEERLLELTNETRKKNDLAPLKLDPLLTELARKHSANMVKQRMLNHKLDGKSPKDRLDDAGYLYFGYGENIHISRFKGDAAAEDVVKGWMSSAGHRGNMLGKAFRATGVGMVRDSRGLLWTTMIYAIPRKR